MICRSNMIPFGNGDYHKGLFIDGRLSVDFERELDKVTFGMVLCQDLVQVKMRFSSS